MEVYLSSRICHWLFQSPCCIFKIKCITDKIFHEESFLDVNFIPGFLPCYRKSSVICTTCYFRNINNIITPLFILRIKGSLWGYHFYQEAHCRWFRINFNVSTSFLLWWIYDYGIYCIFSVIFFSRPTYMHLYK